MAMPRDPEPTQRQLLDAAERLFSRRGIEVPLREVARAAGQGNPGVVQYHFGNRTGLLKAISARHMPGVRERRLELLKEAGIAGRDLRGVADAAVRPIAELADGEWRGRAYLRILAALLNDPTRSDSELPGIIGDTGMFETVDAFLELLPNESSELVWDRVRIGTSMVAHACADRARLVDRSRRARPLLDSREFVGGLVDVYAGVITAPVGPRS
jgi:AcrR family transcriptional regulator